MSSTRRKTLWLILLASLAFNAGVGATFGVRAYQHVREPDRPRHGRKGCKLTEELGLTPEQEQTVDAARTELMDALRELRGRLREHHDKLADLMAANEPDREAIAEQISKIASLHEDKQHQLVEHFLDIKQLLEPDQQEKFNADIHRAMSRHGHRHGGHGGRRHHGRGGHGPKGRFHGDDDSDSRETKETQ
jgi:Spy/CpxP family protein refolding chaperone